MYKTPQLEINKEVLALVSEVDEAKGYWKCLEKFCGTDLCPQEAIKESSIAVSKVLKYAQPVDMSGYVLAMNWIISDYNSIEFNENTIDKLYNMIENKPANAKIERQTEETPAEEPESSFGSFFGGMSLYEDETPKAPKKAKSDVTLKDLTDWTNKEIKAGKLHPLLVISTFAAEFLHLTAYPSANSRLSRILTILLLLKSGYTYTSICSLDSILDREYGLYEAAYDSVLNEEKVDYNFWNIVYLKIFRKQAETLLKAVEEIKPETAQAVEEDCPLCSLADPQGCESNDECPLCELADEPSKTKALSKNLYKELPVLQTKIMKMFTKNERITISQVVETTKANVNTVKKHLASLTEKNLIEKHGKTKGAWYTQSLS